MESHEHGDMNLPTDEQQETETTIHAGKPAQALDFVTLGMFIIDDIYPPATAQNQTPNLNVIGGAGTFAAIGARLFSPPPRSRNIGWIIDAGSDFPSSMRSEIDSWKTGLLWRPRDAPTTRAWNHYYGENEHRAFKYLTEKNRLTVDDLTPEMISAKCIHLICSPSRCIDMTKRIRNRRIESSDCTVERPYFIWEPVPDLCTPEALSKTIMAVGHVDVVSPNHEELGALFDFKHGFGADRKMVERHANELLARGIGPKSDGAIVVRCGRDGCFVANLNQRGWLPAFYAESTKVVDPTGAGNGFLGAFGVGLVRNMGNIVEAAIWGTIAASFCIEQVGVPTLDAVSSSESNAEETWNGREVKASLKWYNQYRLRKPHTLE